MRGLGKYLAGSALSVAMFFSAAAQAMELPQYDNMSPKDRGDYAGQLMQGTYDLLKVQLNRPDDAQKMLALFTTKAPGEKISIGASQFKDNLTAYRALNEDKKRNPNHTIYEVEDAWSQTLEDNGIVVPFDKLQEICKNFKPSATKL